MMERGEVTSEQNNVDGSRVLGRYFLVVRARHRIGLLLIEIGR